MRTYLSCPFAVVDAPAETVWGLLLRPEGWGEFFDLRVKKVEPPGAAKAGTSVVAVTSFLDLNVTARFLEINKTKGFVKIYLELPFWLRNDEVLEIHPMTKKSCIVKYNCNLRFKNDLLGGLLIPILAGKFENDPADSLARLKRAAEARYKKTG